MRFTTRDTSLVNSSSGRNGGGKTCRGFWQKWGACPTLPSLGKGAHKIRFSLQQCQQTYAHMDVDLKLSLFSSVETLAPEYGLFDLTFPSFIRKNGYRIDLSASDVIEAVGSLLEVATGIRLDFGGVSAVGGGGSGAAGVGMGLHGAGGGREEWKAEGMSRWIEGVEGAPDKSIASLAGNTADGGVAEEEGEEERRKEKQESDWATRNFWLAWDSLDNE